MDGAFQLSPVVQLIYGHDLAQHRMTNDSFILPDPLSDAWHTSRHQTDSGTVTSRGKAMLTQSWVLQ